MESTEPVILISPTEPRALREIGIVNSAVEKKGCDVLISTPTLRIGIQRKTWTDLVISLDDGRLANSIPKMDMAVRAIVLEGKLFFDRSGHMVVRSNSPKAKGGWVTLRHTKESIFGVQFSLRYNSGIDVFRTESLAETVTFVRRLGKYLSKSKHRGISGDRSHSTDIRSPWGGLSPEERHRAQRINFLMGCGIGLQTAKNLIDANGGKLPLAWTVDEEFLLNVPLIGQSTAQRLMRFLEE